jgi:DNA-binding NarL/FixJ family response regulator
MADDLAAINSASDRHRFLLRTASPYRYLATGMRQLEELRDLLARMPTSAVRRETYLAMVSEVLDRQRGVLESATAILADVLRQQNANRVEVDQRSTGPLGDTRPVPGLTMREARVLALYASGLAQRDIAARLGISFNTVRLYLERIRIKLGARTNAELVAAALRLGLQGPTPAPPATGERLTKREQSVLELLGEGLSTPEIAAQLYISIGTVRVHVARLKRKLGARSQAETVVAARRLGLLVDTPATGSSSEDEQAANGGLAQIERLFRQSTDELGQLGDRLSDHTGALHPEQRLQCLRMADDLAGLMRKLWDALSNFRGADLRATNAQLQIDDLEDLDGVCWSDEQACGRRRGVLDYLAASSWWPPSYSSGAPWPLCR